MIDRTETNRCSRLHGPFYLPRFALDNPLLSVGCCALGRAREAGARDQGRG
jgi:hypothetical protein